VFSYKAKEGAVLPEGLECWEIDGGDYLVFAFSLPEDAPDPLDTLTEAERQVVALALSGLSDQQIAEQRGSKPRTIANQLRSAYRKLGVCSRIELAQKVAGRGLPAVLPKK
jgi:DNA-binding NarL/FixJ family response regulator